jgi:hypothetical protein
MISSAVVVSSALFARMARMISNSLTIPVTVPRWSVTGTPLAAHQQLDRNVSSDRRRRGGHNWPIHDVARLHNLPPERDSSFGFTIKTSGWPLIGPTSPHRQAIRPPASHATSDGRPAGIVVAIDGRESTILISWDKLEPQKEASSPATPEVL